MKLSSEPMLSSYLHSRGASLGLPISGTFELTARCNFSCPMCYVHLQNAKAEEELSASQWLDIASQAKDQGMMFVLLTGGEPFIRKDFFEIYEGIKSLGLMVSINTNGSMLSGDVRDKLIENPPVRMNISLYGGCSETYRKMCGPDAFDDVVENIRALKQAGIDIRLNYSITPENHTDMEKILQISNSMDVHIKASSYMYPPVRTGSEDRRMSPERSAQLNLQWDRLRLSDDEFSHRLQAASSLECGVEEQTGVGCRAGITSFWLTWDGRMLPCGMMPGAGADVLSMGFQAAWEQTKDTSRQIRMPARCAGCEMRKLCSVCAAVCISETGHFDKVPEYVCRRTEEMVRLMRLIQEKEDL